MHCSGLDKNKIDCALDEISTMLVSGENSEWIVDNDDSDDDEIIRPCKGENESETESTGSGKG